MLNLIVWGNLAQDVIKYYKINDYIIVEGFFRQKRFKKCLRSIIWTKSLPIYHTTTITETSLFK